MIRELKRRAQQLFWTAHELEESIGPEAAKDKYAELVPLHKQLAQERFRLGEPGAWIDALAAVTYLGKSGQREAARQLLDEYRHRAEDHGLEEVLSELDSLQGWLNELFGRPDASDDSRKEWAEVPERVALSWLVEEELDAA